MHRVTVVGRKAVYTYNYLKENLGQYGESGCRSWATEMRNALEIAQSMEKTEPDGMPTYKKPVQSIFWVISRIMINWLFSVISG